MLCSWQRVTSQLFEEVVDVGDASFALLLFLGGLVVVIVVVTLRIYVGFV